MLSAFMEAEGACGKLGTDLSRVIAVSVVVDTAVRVADTLRAHATALTARGDSVDATFRWASFDTTILAVADSTAGVFVGTRTGFTSIQARTGDLRSPPFPVHVKP